MDKTFKKLKPDVEKMKTENELKNENCKDFKALLNKSISYQGCLPFIDEMHSGEGVLIQTTSLTQEIELARLLRTNLEEKYGKYRVCVILAHDFALNYNVAVMNAKNLSMQVALRKNTVIAVIGLQSIVGLKGTRECLLFLFQNILFNNGIVIASINI